MSPAFLFAKTHFIRTKKALSTSNSDDNKIEKNTWHHWNRSFLSYFDQTLNDRAGNGGMNCQNGRHLFVIGRMDVLVNRIASQFHLKFQKKITNSRNELQLGYSHMNNRHYRPIDGGGGVTICQVMTQLGTRIELYATRWHTRVVGMCFLSATRRGSRRERPSPLTDGLTWH